MKNLGQMMKQAQELQARMGELQERLAGMEVSGSSGGDLVTVVLNGKGEMRRTQVDASLLKGEEKEVLEDLICAAHNDAKGRLERLVSDEMSKLTGGMPLPPGFKLPF